MGRRPEPGDRAVGGYRLTGGAGGSGRTHYWRLRNHGTVADDLPISRHTIPQIRCPACWLDIPNQTPVPYHADSTGITTCPASGQALTREKENA